MLNDDENKKFFFNVLAFCCMRKFIFCYDEKNRIMITKFRQIRAS